MLDLIELFTHWHAGRSQVQLSQSLGIDRKTIRKYLAPAIAEGIKPGSEPLSADRWAGLIAGWFPQLSDPAVRRSTWPLIASHHNRIKDWLDADVTVATIAQRLRDEHAVDASESSVRRRIATGTAAFCVAALGGELLQQGCSLRTRSGLSPAVTRNWPASSTPTPNRVTSLEATFYYLPVKTIEVIYPGLH